MENNDKKKRSLVRTVVLVILVAAVAAAAVWWLVPVSLFPKEYSKVTFHYIMIDGTKYDKTDDGWPSEEQLAQIESILKPLKMTHTREAVDYSEVVEYKLYIPFSFENEKGVIFRSGCIAIFPDLSAKSRILPFVDSYTHIENGAAIYQQIMEVLGR